MELLVARHGQTIWNQEGRVCGLTNVALTAYGLEQAKELGLLAMEKEIDIILSSPLQRAVQTAEIVADICGKIPIKIEPRLVEQNYGIYEGVLGKDGRFLQNKRQFAYRYPKGESMMQMAARVYPLLDEIRERYDGKRVLIISHGGVCRIIRSYFVDMDNEEFFGYVQKNCRLETYTY